jgi:hypothetical protein
MFPATYGREIQKLHVRDVKIHFLRMILWYRENGVEAGKDIFSAK